MKNKKYSPQDVLDMLELVSLLPVYSGDVYENGCARTHQSDARKVVPGDTKDTD